MIANETTIHKSPTDDHMSWYELHYRLDCWFSCLNGFPLVNFGLLKLVVRYEPRLRLEGELTYNGLLYNLCLRWRVVSHWYSYHIFLYLDSSELWYWSKSYVLSLSIKVIKVKKRPNEHILLLKMQYHVQAKKNHVYIHVY